MEMERNGEGERDLIDDGMVLHGAALGLQQKIENNVDAVREEEICRVKHMAAMVPYTTNTQRERERQRERRGERYGT
jgi:chloramphenicol 3-O-phosphotransferase